MAKVKQVEDNPVYVVEGPVEIVPDINSEAWVPFLKGKLRQNEKDKDGNPLVGGLRRLTDEYFGTVVASVGKVVQSPSPQNGFVAVAEHNIVVAFGRDPKDLRTFGDVADVHPGNADAMFAAHATAFASTRAEARAYRKLLRLTGCSAEELVAPVGGSYVPTEDEKAVRLRAMQRQAKRLKIDVQKFINSGQDGRQYESVDDIPNNVLSAMNEKLNQYGRDPDLIPKELLS